LKGHSPLGCRYRGPEVSDSFPVGSVAEAVVAKDSRTIFVPRNLPPEFV